ncbi:zinc ribbon domain-containing protein YjdM [Nocardioides limicola]|uniref:zinc ribbon domain-containing protein YjdM n=1 Tax=Nocardioides limicola TaxID=2803368 RepID=UPI00193B10BC|nr:zinc ribbon domain-containing protein YjdM [Nocardioides sp. DJM-14]
MTEALPACPVCSGEFTYAMGELMICPECGHEWSPTESAEAAAAATIRDANGTPLADGDDVVVIKDLKVKGGSGSIKVGTKVRNIRLVDGVGDHDLDCKVDGFGPMQLKSSVVRKA